MIANPRSRHRVAIIPASDERVFEVKDSDKTSILIEPGIREDTTASPVVWIAAKFAAADEKKPKVRLLKNRSLGMGSTKNPHFEQLWIRSCRVLS